MGTLIPGAALIYERANGVVYARYRDPPHNALPRWIVGGDPIAVGEAQGELLPYADWVDMCHAALENKTLKRQLDKAIEIYYIIKDNK